MKHILLVEDDDLIGSAMGDSLERAGYTVTVVTDGVKGLATALRVHPDIILLDIMLPSMDGLSILERLRKDDWGRSVPVMVLSNKEDISVITQAVREYAQAYFIKSDTSLSTIVKAVEELLAATE